MSKPITPAEARKKKLASIPDFVIEAFNELIAEKIDSGGKAIVKQEAAVERILSKGCQVVGTLRREQIFDNGWLNIETIFSNAGWEVEYDKPGYNETYEAYFVFKDPLLSFNRYMAEEDEKNFRL